MPRPPMRVTENVKGVKVNLHPSVWEALRVRAFEERTTLSAQARKAIDAYLAKKGKKWSK